MEDELETMRNRFLLDGIMITPKSRATMSANNSPTQITSSTPLLAEEEEDRQDQQGDNRARASLQRDRRLFSMMMSPLTDDHDSVQSIFVGLLFVTLCGSTVGLLVPKNEALPSPFYRTISSMIGYTCFVAWGVSFYPQMINNLKRRTTVGLSADFCGLNVVGFACYAIYTLAMFYSAEVQREYRNQHGDDAHITVQSNDVAFAVHSFLLASVTLFQIVYFDGIRSQQRPSRIIVCLIAIICFFALVYPLVKIAGCWKIGTWLDYLYMLSFVKILVTLIKYIPQVVLNVQRKSTVGFSIWQILLDLNGGVLNDLQLVLDSMALKDWSGITGNPAKLCLGTVSIMFDVIFIVQHYWLYRSMDVAGGETEPLTIVEINIMDEEVEETSDAETSASPTT